MAKREPRPERRQHSRVTANLAVEVSAAHAEGRLQILTESINISTGGVYCSVKRSVPVPSKVSLSIQLPRFGAYKKTQVIRCEAMVVRCQKTDGTAVGGARYDLACAFLDLDADTRGLINEFVLWKSLKPVRAAD